VTVLSPPHNMNEQIKTAVAELMMGDFANWTHEKSNEVMLGYIFGPYDTDNHINIDEFTAVYNELKADKDAIIAEIESKLRGTFEGYTVTTEGAFKTDLTDGVYWVALDVYTELKGENTWSALKDLYKG